MTVRHANEIPLDDEEKDVLRSEDTALFKYVPETEMMIDKRRWCVRKSRVYKRDGLDEYYEFSWDEPATENQEYEPDSALMRRVYPHVVTKIVYRKEPVDAPKTDTTA